jgi:hypothetical protein
MRSLIVVLFVVIGVQSWRAESWKAQRPEPVLVARNAFSLPYAVCSTPAMTKTEIVAWLKTLDRDLLGLLAYVDNDGNTYALSETMLKGQP